MINKSHTKRNKAFASLEKALDIFKLYDIDNREFSAQEISDSLDIPLSSTYKYIDILVRRQFLSRRPNSKRVRLGLVFSTLGKVFAEDFRLVDLAHPSLEQLSQVTGETAMITIIEGNEAACLDRVEPRCLIKFSLEPGRRLPLHVGASSRILLAFQDDAFINAYLKENELIKLGSKTIINKIKLKAELKQNRTEGFVFSSSEADEGTAAISAPIIDQKGKLIAGLTVAGPAERIKDQNLSSLIDITKTLANKISKALGTY